MPSPAPLRDDLDEPVLTFQTETDLVTLGFLPARQPDTKRLRLWEVAGTAHSDVYQLGAGSTDTGPAGLDTSYLPPQTSVFGVITCAQPINAGPHHFVLMAAFSQLDRWVRRGKPPRRAPRLAVTDGTPAAFELDALGNVEGGIRTHMVEAPIARHSGLGQTGGSFCRLFGTSVRFDAATLADLYPSNKRYVAAVRRATRKAVQRGWVLETDAKGIIAAAKASGIGDAP